MTSLDLIGTDLENRNAARLTDQRFIGLLPSRTSTYSPKRSIASYQAATDTISAP